MSLVKRKQQPLPYKRPPKRLKKAKQIEKYAAAYARGITIGTQKGHEKKSLEDSLREHIGKWIDNINPLEVVAIAGMTIVIHNFILDPANNLLGSAMKVAANVPKEAADFFVNTIKSEVYPALRITGLSFLIPGLKPTLPGVGSDQKSTDQTIGFPQWELWLLSFTFAYILVKYGAQILGAIQGGLGAILPMLMGAAL